MTNGISNIFLIITAIFSIPVGIYYALLLKDRWSSPEKSIISKLPESIKLGFRVSIFFFFLEVALTLAHSFVSAMWKESPLHFVIATNVCILLGLPIGFWVISKLFRKYL